MPSSRATRGSRSPDGIAIRLRPAALRKGTIAVTPKEVLAQIRQREVTTVDLRFMDFPGVWQHFSIPADSLTEETFEEGIGFDGSSVVGWRAINEADLLVVPQPETVLIDPFTAQPTLTMVCNIQDPITQQDYTRDPRNIARKAVSYMRSTGLADACEIAPELEFFVFDDVRYDQRGHEAFYHVDSVEGSWNRGRVERPNLGYKPGSGGGYFPCPPTDTLADLRSEMAQRMAECGIATSAHYHEVATGGQCEIDLMPQSLVESADQVMLAKYIIRNVARRNGRTATFMPKPLYGDNGSGMHIHLTLWKNDAPLLAGNGYAGLSDLGMFAIGGLLRHAPALCAFGNPTTNSYKRLVPGFEAPTKLSYSRRNRTAIIRIPIHSPSPRSRRIEYRCPDGAANPYLLFSAMLMAALDGIQNKIRPGDPLDKDIYDLQPEELENVPETTKSLEASLQALRADHEFLLRGDVFTPDVIDTWIWYKQAHEVEALRVRPHPHEFTLYYDV
ncbi:MAG: type I glutamate--ammonia ligase [Planctomycetaceae bacterium]|nr:type I glutamate--ammonia ligase [Planctomycetaceae bacterium]MBV8678552.1 type I glutamate--ammonia ligase [Planctomycetaceae bacterium]